MGKFIDLTGQKFGKLTALYRGEKAERGRSVKWYCPCDCGNYCWIGSNALRTGNSKSCGCLKKETSAKSGRKNKGRRKRFNSFEFMDDCVIGYDNKGNSFYIDTEDLDKVQKYCWYKSKDGYWMSSYTDDEGQHKHLKLHKYITNTGSKQIIDHQDRNKDNNRKNNLIYSDRHRNARNSSKPKNNISGYIGIYYNKKRREWKASVSKNNKEVFLGWYKNKEDALRARLQGEAKYYGLDAPQRHLFKQYGIEVDE